MAVPIVLGRDDATVELFPSLVAETAAGFYVDPQGNSRYIVLAKSGATPIWAGVTDGSEMRAGIGGISIGGVALGSTVWFTRNAEHERQKANTRGIFDKSTSALTYAGAVGASAGQGRGVHVDSALEFGQTRHRAHASWASSLPSGPVVTDENTPPTTLDWQARGLLSIPAGAGWVRSAVRGEFSTEPRTSYSDTGAGLGIAHSFTRSSVIRGDLAWMGPVRRVDMVAVGVSLSRSYDRD